MNVVVPFFRRHADVPRLGRVWRASITSALGRAGRISSRDDRKSPRALLAGSIAALFAVFPMAIIGAMMLLVGVELTKFAKDVAFNRDLAPMALTVVLALVFNMAVGFFAGLALYHLMRRIAAGKGRVEG